MEIGQGIDKESQRVRLTDELQGFIWGSGGIKNLCVMETLCFFFKRMLLNYGCFVDINFFHLIRGTTNNILNETDLHKVKLPIIDLFKNLCPTWVPGVYVGINEQLTPLINSDPRLKEKFSMQITKTMECKCGIEVCSHDCTSMAVSEIYLKQAGSLLAGIRRSKHRTMKSLDVCTICQAPKQLQETVTRMPELLLIELDSGIQPCLSSVFEVETVLHFDDERYSLVGAMRIDGQHATGYFVHDNKVYCYDGMQNRGRAKELQISQLKSLPFTTFRHFSHVLYIKTAKYTKELAVDNKSVSLFASINQNPTTTASSQPSSSSPSPRPSSVQLFEMINNNRSTSSTAKKIMVKRKLSPVHVKKSVMLKCCTQKCCRKFDSYEVLFHRNQLLEEGQIEGTNFIKLYIRQHMRNGEILWAFSGKEVCQLAWFTLYGFSAEKFFKAKRQELQGSFHVIHGNCFREYNKPKTISVSSWISNYCEKYGDYVPTSKEVHLSGNLTLPEWYEEYYKEASLYETDTKPASFKTFCLIRNSQFKHVKFPKVTRLGKCSICVSNRKARLQCQSIKEISVLKKELKEHFKLTAGEKQLYHERKSKAFQHPTAILSFISDKTKDVDIPTFNPLPKSWTRAKRHSVGIMGILNHSLGTKELVLFSSDQWTLDSNFFLTILHNSIVNALKAYTNEKPRTLYIQTDNCAAESKNQYLLCYLACLVDYKVFDEIYFHTLIPGHTHEDIDQIFSTLHQKLETASIETIAELQEFIQTKVYSKSPTVTWLDCIYDWKSWMAAFCNSMKGHKSPHAFLLKHGSDGKVHLHYKKYSRDSEWIVDEKKGEIFNSKPIGLPQKLYPAAYNQMVIKEMVDLCRQHLSQIAVKWWLAISKSVKLLKAHSIHDNPFSELTPKMVATPEVKTIVPASPVIKFTLPQAKRKMPDSPPTPRKKRGSVKSYDSLLELLSELKKSFETSPKYQVSTLQVSLKNLLGFGSLFITDMSMNKDFEDEISALKSRAEAIQFMQGLVDDYELMISKLGVKI